jgi:hypothetical protein
LTKKKSLFCFMIKSREKFVDRKTFPMDKHIIGSVEIFNSKMGRFAT